MVVTRPKTALLTSPQTLDPKSADEYFGIKYLSGTSRFP